MVPKFYAIFKFSGEVSELISNKDFKTVVETIQKQLEIFEKELENKKYFGGKYLCTQTVLQQRFLRLVNVKKKKNIHTRFRCCVLYNYARE